MRWTLVTLVLAALLVGSCSTSGTGGGGAKTSTGGSGTQGVKLKVELVKDGKVCLDLLKCPTYADGTDIIEVRATATRDKAPVSGVNIRFSKVLPKTFTGDDPVTLSCIDPCLTGADGVSKTSVTNSLKSGLELDVKAEVAPTDTSKTTKSTISGKATVRFIEPVPVLSLEAENSKYIVAATGNDTTTVKATVNYGEAPAPDNVAVQFTMDSTSTTYAGFDAGQGVTPKDVATSYTKSGKATVAVRSKASNSTTNQFVRITAVSTIGTTTASGFVYLIMGQGPAVLLTTEGDNVAESDGLDKVALVATVFDQANAKLGGVTVRFETQAGVFPNRSRGYETPADSSGVAKIDLTSYQPSSGFATARTASTVTGCPTGGCTSQNLLVTFVGTCEKGKVDTIELLYEGCPGGAEVVPCQVQNSDDTTTPEITENEVTILARALDTAKKPVSNAVVKFCTTLPHHMETSSGGTVAATDGSGLSRIQFVAGPTAESALVRAYVGCPQTDPCTTVINTQTNSEALLPFEGDEETVVKDVIVNVTPSTGFTVAFDPAPIVIGVRGTGNDTATVSVEVRDKYGNLVEEQSTVRFTFKVSGGGETLNPTETQTLGGTATTTVRAGTTPGTLQLVAEVVLPNDTISATARNIVVQSGPPATDHFGIARTPVNIAGFIAYGLEVSVTAYVGDRYGNPAAAGTSVFFATEAGVIEGGGEQVLSSTGDAGVTHISAAPRPSILETCPGNDLEYCASQDTIGSVSGDNDPSDGRVSIVSYTRGTEGFFDMDGDGVYLEDGGCKPGYQCPTLAATTTCSSSSPTSSCTADPYERNGCWDECEDNGSGTGGVARDGSCQSGEFQPYDSDSNGTNDTTICRMGEDVFCILCTSSCGSGTAPTMGFSKTRHKDDATRDITQMPDKACQNLVHDRGEPFINFNESRPGDAEFPTRDLDEVFFDLNANGAYDPPNGTYDLNAPVWDDTLVVYSDSVGTFNIACVSLTSPPTSYCENGKNGVPQACSSGCSGGQFLVQNGCLAQLRVTASDVRGNPLVQGCSVTLTIAGSGGASIDAALSISSFTVPDCVYGSSCTTFDTYVNDSNSAEDTADPPSPNNCNLEGIVSGVVSATLTGCANFPGGTMITSLSGTLD